MTEINAYIGLGSNLGDRAHNLRQAMAIMDQTKGIRVVANSPLIETKPVGVTDQPDFINCVCKIATSLSANQLLNALQKTENKLHRTRTKKWGPRTIDLDILFYGQEIINEPELIVPHPRLHLRTFVLQGLCDLTPDFIHPVLQTTLSGLVSRLKGRDFSPNPDTPKLISIAGLIGVGKTTLTDALADSINADRIYEPYGQNPFLPKVYEGNTDLALDSQLFFLIKRADQLAPAALSKNNLTISDYLFQKELIYARQTLAPDQLSIYERVYQPFRDRVTTPAVVVYLKDQPSNCLERIHLRNRSYEQKIELSFLKALADEYELLIQNWTSSPVITIDAHQLVTGRIKTHYIAKNVKAYIAEK